MSCGSWRRSRSTWRCSTRSGTRSPPSSWCCSCSVCSSPTPGLWRWPSPSSAPADRIWSSRCGCPFRSRRARWGAEVDILASLVNGFAVALTPTNLLYCFLGSLIGTAIGVLPGLGPPATIALLLPVTYGINATSAVILLAGIFYGAMYGGSTTSILLNIPGEAASVVTCLDGYQMARQGRAGAALAISAFGSFIAGTLSIVGLMLLAPPMAAFALKFGAPENFALLVLGLMMAGYLAGASMTKGLMMAVLGLLLGTVGLDPIMGSPRFTFGIFKLSEGFEFVLVAMGLFGIGEVLANVEQSIKAEVFKAKIGGLLPSRQEWREASAPIARGSVLGFLIGVLPGGGAIISSFISYALEKKLSRTPERFGHGAIAGVAGPESARSEERRVGKECRSRWSPYH